MHQTEKQQTPCPPRGASGVYGYPITAAQGTLTINQATLTVTANNTNRVYGAANPTFTARYSGFVNGETNTVLSGSPSLTTTATGASSVGGYTITAAQGTLSAANYTLSFSPGTLTINRATLTVTANDTNRLFRATNLVFTASYSGFVNGETNTVLSGRQSNCLHGQHAHPARSAGSMPLLAELWGSVGWAVSTNMARLRRSGRQSPIADRQWPNGNCCNPCARCDMGRN